MLKVKGIEEMQEEIKQMLSGISNYLREKNERGITMQSELGIKHLFRGQATKTGETSMMRKVKQCKNLTKSQLEIVQFFIWKHRNNKMTCRMILNVANHMCQTGTIIPRM